MILTIRTVTSSLLSSVVAAIVVACMALTAIGMSSMAMAGDEPLMVRHYQVQERYAFGARLLDLALTKGGLPYTIQAPAQQEVNEGAGELMVIDGELDVQWHSTSKKRESSMIPIRIPIYRGVLGLRLLLAKNNRAEELSAIRSAADLGGYIAGHGTHWGDLPVYAANFLAVQTHEDYETLFTMLIDGRFDYFHRGISEVWQEQKRYADDLAVVDSVMLFYPHPVYFFVTKNKPELAKRIEQGLLAAMKDGSYKKMFLAEYHPFLRKANLIKRYLILLKNPVRRGKSAMDTSWWLPNTKVPMTY